MSKLVAIRQAICRLQNRIEVVGATPTGGLLFIKMENIIDKYNKIKNNYDLPNFEDLDKEFEISTIESEKFLLREIINKIIERIDIFSCLLEELLQPDSSSLKSMHESRFIEDSDRKIIYEIYKKLMVINRESKEVSLKRDEKEEADYINRTFKKWKEIKIELLKYVNIMKNTWEKETDIKEELGYFG